MHAVMNMAECISDTHSIPSNKQQKKIRKRNKQERKREKKWTLNIKIKSQLMYRNEESTCSLLTQTLTTWLDFVPSLVFFYYVCCLSVCIFWNEIESSCFYIRTTLSFDPFTFEINFWDEEEGELTLFLCVCVFFYASFPVDELLNHFSFLVCFSSSYLIYCKWRSLKLFFHVFSLSIYKMKLNNKE